MIIGNPPYSVGQKSANDNAQNQNYPFLDNRVAETYTKLSNSGLKKSLYDPYIKAFRWATDRIDEEHGGVIAFISNGKWLDANSTDGFRKCLEKDFSSIYIFNLRGNQRTNGELSRKEGGKIFGSGSRSQITITFLIRKRKEQKEKAVIHYYDIGDYLDRDEKLAIIRKFKHIENINFSTLAPNEHGDWLDLRNDKFEELIPLAPDKKFDPRSQSVFTTYAIGLASNRDAWVYNFSEKEVLSNMQQMIQFYNEQCVLYKESKEDNKELTLEEFINTDPTKISWTVNLKKHLRDSSKLKWDSNTLISGYRPFCKQYIYYSTSFIERPGLSKKLFPKMDSMNKVICLSGISGSKEFSVLITNSTPNLDYIEKSQCFPLYWYEENKHKQKTLFDIETDDDYIRRDAVSDWILKQVRERFNKAKNITKETIFYYVYGLLHAQEYREVFASNLNKSLPRIPIVDDIDEFMDFSMAGKQLAKLHLDYEEVAPCPSVVVSDSKYPLEENVVYPSVARQIDTYISEKDYNHYAVEKMRFPKKDQKDCIIYNSRIRINNIPEEAYEYVINGRSAIEWIMERYQVKIDRVSLIKNDPNDWSKEHEKPRYILDLLLSIINVSVQTANIVKKLPKLKL